MTDSVAAVETQSSPANPPSLFWVGAIAASAAGCLALATASQTYLAMWTHGHSFVRILLWQLGCWSPWALVAPWVVRMSGRHGLKRLAALGAGLTIAQWLIAAQLSIWLQPFLPLVPYSFGHALANLWWFLVLVDPLVFGLLVVGGRAFTAFEHGRSLELRRSQLEAQLARAQLDALRLEIQPHFLFNTLNSIGALIRVNDSQAALSMLIGLGELMRATLDAPTDPLTPLGDELRLVKRYVDLQRARFGDRLNVSYQIEAGCEVLSVPTLLLQPLVENALRHGLAPQTRPCRISIAAARHGDARLTVRIADTGAGLPPGFDLARDAGTGLGNTRSRLQQLYGTAASLTIRPREGGGTLVELDLPAVIAAAGPALASGAA